MTRRKGEQPVARPLDRYHDAHPVARCIADGDHWLYSWLSQKATPYAVLARKTGIPAARFQAIAGGDAVSRAEIDGLARAWSVSSEDLIRSIGTASAIVD